ncbi:MAG: TIGR04157 family glycosyltransferase [Tannerella sp.]|jgi:glycosyltransferase|nr:TIGR04157 family glycosyltransferase [Tannerella sp.]
MTTNLYIFNQTRRGAVFGVGTYIRELTAALKESDINICVVNLISEKSQIQTEDIDGIKHWYFPLAISDQRTTSNDKQWELYFRNIVYLLRLHIEDKKNLIFHLNFHQNISLVEELKNAFDCRIVSAVHFTDWGFTVFDNLPRLRNILNEEYPDSFDENVKKAFEEEILYYAKVDHVICLSDYMKEILCLDYGLDETKISVIPNGLEDNGELNIENGESTKGALRKKWNILHWEKIILFVGRIDEVKGVIYLIRAFREIIKKNQAFRLIIAGSGDYDKCFQKAKGICSKITFTGLLAKEDLHEIYQIADVGVVPSLFEPFGYVPVEMMMHKLPIVATATSGINEVVDNTCGLKIPLIMLPDRVEIDTMLLAEKILYLLRHPIEAKQMGKNGRKRYLNNYSSKIFRRNMLQIYKSMCK